MAIEWHFEEAALRLDLAAILVWGFASGCSADGAAAERPARPAPTPEQVEAERRAVDGFCSKHDAEPFAKPFGWPDLADGATAPAAGRSRWVVGWATWCGPCLREMPLIEKWRGALAADGVDVEVTYVSVDEEKRKLSNFAERHPELDVHLRVAEGGLESWFHKFDLPPETLIPIHFMVDPKGRTRCVRSGSVGEDDYAAVRRILQGG